MRVKMLVTGVAGFIGMHCAKRLLERGDEVIGIDNLSRTTRCSSSRTALRD